MYQTGSIVFENWTITEKLGSGSFGTVYALQREDFGEVYRSAMKVIRVPRDPEEIDALISEGMNEQAIRQYLHSSVSELVHEFSIMAKLKATGYIVSYEDHRVIAHTDGIGWDILIRMEYLTPVLKYAFRHPFTRRDIIQLGIDICKALELCQKYNIIHRDIKPDNIFVSESGTFKLGDFGIARTIEKTTFGLSKKGTYNYMAPEIYVGAEYGFCVDTYSLGIVLYRLLNQNRLPFLPAAPAAISVQDRETALIKRMRGDPLPRPCYGDGRLGEIVLKACAHDPQQRYSSPMQMRLELEAILYEQTDARLIYPGGDEIHLQKNEYLSQSEEASASREKSGTAQVSGKRPKPEGETTWISSETTPDGSTLISDQAAPSPKKRRWLAALAAVIVLAGSITVWGAYRKAGQQKQENFDSCMSQARQYRQSDPDTALALYRSALNLYPHAEEPCIGYAHTLYTAGRLEDCIQYIETDLSNGQNFSDSGYRQLCEILGCAYFDREDYAAAAASFRLCNTDGAVTVSVLRDYAICLIRLDDPDGARAIKDQLSQTGASEAVLAYVQAEIDTSTGNLLPAEENLLFCLQTAGDPALRYRALQSLAALYQKCLAMEREGTGSPLVLSSDASWLSVYASAFPGDYIPHALRAILLIAEEEEKPMEQRNYSKAVAEYETAGTLLLPGDDQTYYQQIQKLIHQLPNHNIS